MTAAVPLMEIPSAPEPAPTPIVPDAPVTPAVPEPGPSTPDTPTGPSAPEPSDPLPPAPEGPDVPVPDPKGPETQGRLSPPRESRTPQAGSQAT